MSPLKKTYFFPRTALQQKISRQPPPVRKYKTYTSYTDTFVCMYIYEKHFWPQG